jgi:Transposase DDE domain
MHHSHATPIFPAWSHRLGAMKPALAATGRNLRQLTLSQLEVRLQTCLPARLLDKPVAGPHSRERIYCLPRTFWAWLWQRLNDNASCREVVRQVQALCALQGGPAPNEKTGGYCQARAQLPVALLEKALAASADTAARRAPELSWLRGRPLKVVDGSGLRLQDTPANQKDFPQPAIQKPGCGFPVMKLVVIFCLASGALLARATGTLRDSESGLFQRLLSSLKPGDIVIGDRGFGNFVMVALLAGMQVDFIGRVPTNARRVDFRQGRRLGRYDRVVSWRKGPRQGQCWSAADWAALPDLKEVRLVRLIVRQRGFRSRMITLVTTLLDAELYPAAELVAAYARRWRLELCLDDLKTTLGLETLKCLSPAMAQKELLVGLIAHNLLRCVMTEAAQAHDAPLERISFKGALDALRQFNHALSQTRCARRKRKLWATLLLALARDLVPERPGRREPRAVKRRPKYDLLTRPRRLFRDRPRRSIRRSIANRKRLI